MPDRRSTRNQRNLFRDRTIGRCGSHLGTRGSLKSVARPAELLPNQRATPATDFPRAVLTARPLEFRAAVDALPACNRPSRAVSPASTGACGARRCEVRATIRSPSERSSRARTSGAKSDCSLRPRGHRAEAIHVAPFNGVPGSPMFSNALTRSRCPSGQVSPPQPRVQWPRARYEACLPREMYTGGPAVNAFSVDARAPLDWSQTVSSCAAAYQSRAAHVPSAWGSISADTCSASRACPPRPQSRAHRWKYCNSTAPSDAGNARP